MSRKGNELLIDNILNAGLGTWKALLMTNPLVTK
jgi:hypothetical protein